MFDDQITNAAPPGNLPSEPEDMFAGVDKVETMPSPGAPNALQAGVLRPKSTQSVPSPMPTQTPSVMTAPAMYAVKEPVVGKIILIIVLLILLGAAGYFGYRFYTGGLFSAPPAPVAPPENNVAPVVAPPVTVPEPAVPETPAEPIVTPLSTTTAEAGINMASDEILFGDGVDTDKDGLDDVRENEIGTSPYQVDTDGDELSDGDEVIIWKTDPLNKDTDKDTYPDGSEVKNGYNPLGPGRLFNVPTTTTK